MIEWEAVPYAICYVVTDGDTVVDITTDTMAELPAGRANGNYAVQAVNEFGGLSAKGLPGTTGIGAVNAEDCEIVAVYDLQGRPLARPTRGVNIVCKRSRSGETFVEKLILK